MKHLFSCTFMAALVLLGVALDSKSWSLVYPGVPDVPLDDCNADPVEGLPAVDAEARREANWQVAAPSAAHTEAALSAARTASDVTAYAYTYTTVKDNTTYLLASGSGDSDVAAMYEVPMGIAAAQGSVLNEAGITMADLADNLTFTLTTTHVDGSVQTRAHPIALTTH